jgi:hypothetical protein
LTGNPTIITMTLLTLIEQNGNNDLLNIRI